MKEDVMDWRERKGQLLKRSVQRANKLGLHKKVPRKQEDNEKVEAEALEARKKAFFAKQLTQKVRGNENSLQ